MTWYCVYPSPNVTVCHRIQHSSSLKAWHHLWLKSSNQFSCNMFNLVDTCDIDGHDWRTWPPNYPKKSFILVRRSIRHRYLFQFPQIDQLQIASSPWTPILNNRNDKSSKIWWEKFNKSLSRQFPNCHSIL